MSTQTPRSALTAEVSQFDAPPGGRRNLRAWPPHGHARDVSADGAGAGTAC